jgi:uncharacterized phage protein (TIGR02218 family)
MALTIPTALQTHLDTDVTTLCFCWEITKTDSTKIGFTNHDNDIVFDSVTFSAETGFSPTAMSNISNATVNELELVGFISASAISDEDIKKKLYDNASLNIYRVNWQDVSQRVKIFSGYLGTVTQGELSLVCEARSLRQMLLQIEGRRYLSACDAMLGDARCGVDLSVDPTHRIDGTVSSVYSRRLFATDTNDIAVLPNGWFIYGKITWLTGDNTGFVTEIKNHTRQISGTEAWIDMWETLPSAIQIGDTFTLQVGCDKTIETCFSKFNNVLNFRGFPRMPRTNITLKVASSEDVFTNDVNNGSWYKI